MHRLYGCCFVRDEKEGFVREENENPLGTCAEKNHPAKMDPAEMDPQYKRNRPVPHREPWAKSPHKLQRHLSADHANKMWTTFDLVASEESRQSNPSTPRNNSLQNDGNIADQPLRFSQRQIIIPQELRTLSDGALPYSIGDGKEEVVTDSGIVLILQSSHDRLSPKKYLDKAGGTALEVEDDGAPGNNEDVSDI